MCSFLLLLASKLIYFEVDDFHYSIPTGTSKENLDAVATALTQIPETFSLFSKSKKLIDQRKRSYFDEGQVDWALGELCAFGSLILDGHPIRLSGQDSQRGTFSHRHAVLKDVETEDLFSPLNSLSTDSANFVAYNYFGQFNYFTN